MGIGENTGCNTGENTASSGGASFLTAPTLFSIDSVDSNSADVSWVPPEKGGATLFYVKDSTGILATVPWGTTETTVAALTASTTYTMWVVTANAIDESVASNTDTAQTLSEVQTLVTDNFEDGQLNLGTPVSSGFYWLAVNSGSVNTLPPAIANTTSIGNSGTGTYGVKFYWDAAGFGGPNELSEFKYVLGGNYTDIWAAFDIYFPTDYKVDRLVTDSGQQKFFNFAHQPVVGETAFVFEMLGQTTNSDNGYLRCVCVWNDRNQGAMHFWDRNTGGVKPNGDNYNEFQGWTSDSNYVLGFKKSEDAGQWRRFIFHAKIPTSGASNAYQSDYGGTLYGYGNDGVLEVWKDGTKIIQWSDANNYGNVTVGDLPYYTGGYILGDKRIGYDRDTALYIDNVQFSTQALA